jgi:hypothetical protein
MGFGISIQIMTQALLPLSGKEGFENAVFRRPKQGFYFLIGIFPSAELMQSTAESGVTYRYCIHQSPVQIENAAFEFHKIMSPNFRFGTW